MASRPVSLNEYAGLRIAIDIHSHLNRILHGQSAADWVFLIMRDLFRILHHNIKIVVVVMGRKPVQKIYSSDLGDGSQITYDKVYSGLLRASANAMKAKEEPKRKNTEELQEVEVPAPKRTVRRSTGLADVAVDPTRFAALQLEKRAAQNGKTLKISVEQRKEEEQEEEEEELQLLRDAAEEGLLGNEYSSSSLVSAAQSESVKDNDELLPVSLLPADNPYLKPTENWVTIDHIRMLRELCTLLGVELVQAPEEAVAECARLEMEHIVDAVASEDNNAFLFGSKWMIRGIFTNPVSVTLNSLEDVGITRGRMLMLAMMIDGDYNANIRRRLFTVGPVRGLEIIAHFPNEDTGLYEFKEWWTRVVKGKGEETDANRKVLARKQWMKRLVMPVDFPPEDLLNALKEPVVGKDRIVVKRANVKDREALVRYVCSVSVKPESRIREYVADFVKRLETYTEDRRVLMKHVKNQVHVPAAFADHLRMIQTYDTAVSAANPHEALSRQMAAALDDDDLDVLDEEEQQEEETAFEDA